MARKTIAKAKPSAAAKLSVAGRKLGRLARTGIVAAALASGLHGTPAEAMRGFSPASRPFALQLEKLDNHAKTVAANFSAHVKPEDALSLIQSQDYYEGKGKLHGYLEAMADLTRVMAGYPDWSLTESIAQTARFVKPEVIRQMDPLSTNPVSFNGHVLDALKRISFFEGNKVSSQPEFGGMDASPEVRKFYQDITPEQLKNAMEVLKQTQKEYAQNDVYWDARLITRSWKPSMLIDLAIARHLKKTKGADFWKAGEVGEKDRETIRFLVFRGTRDGDLFTAPDGRQFKLSGSWIDSYRSMLANASRRDMPTYWYDPFSLVVSKGSIGPEDSKARHSRLVAYYRILADGFLDAKGNFKPDDAVSKANLRSTAEGKIWKLKAEIEELKMQKQGKRAQAVGTLIADYESRIKDLTKKYIEGKDSSSATGSFPLSRLAAARRRL